MATNIRPEISKKNVYWIEKHRYYELKHFCLQYPVWKKAHALLGFLNDRPLKEAHVQSSGMSDPTFKYAEARLYYSQRMRMVEKVAERADPVIGKYVFKAVISGSTYACMNASENIPCGKDQYYEVYRRFFWLLDQERK